MYRKRSYPGPTGPKLCSAIVKTDSGPALCMSRRFRHTLCLEHFKQDKIKKARNLLSVTVVNKEKQEKRRQRA